MEASCSMALLSQVSTSYPRVPRDSFARTRAFLPTQNGNTTDCRQVCIVFLFILLLLLTSWKKAYYTSKYNMPFYSGLPRPFDKSRISPHLPENDRPSPAQEAGPTGLRPVVAVTITQRWCRYPEWTASPQDPEHTCHLHMPAR